MAEIPKSSIDDLSPELQRKTLIAFIEQHAAKLKAEKEKYEWKRWARDAQIPPPKFSIWAILAGRGFGKTRVLSEFCRERAYKLVGSHGVIVGRTAADVRDVIVEGGESSILKISPPDFYPKYEPSKKRLTWPNGSTASLYSADEPDSLRGPQGHWGVCDELAAWGTTKDDTEAYDNFMFGMRLRYKGHEPQIVIGTTPRPVKVIRELVAKSKVRGSGVFISTGSTYDNRANLSEKFFSQVISQYEGTRTGRQELDGELLEDIPGQLWEMSQFDNIRVKASEAPEMSRIVVAIDPSVTSGENSDECGISVAGIGADGLFYILKDASGVMKPSEWASKAVSLYHQYHADLILGERNNGGDLVEQTLRTVDEFIPYRSVWASSGKSIRAQPIAALFEQMRVRLVMAVHYGEIRNSGYEKMETQFCGFTNEAYEGEGSPDRAEAAIWALSELLENGRSVARMFPEFRDSRRAKEPENAVHVVSIHQNPGHGEGWWPKPWWQRWISASITRQESAAHWWVKSPDGRVSIYRELVLQSVSPEEFGAEIATRSVDELNEQRNIPVWMAETAFEKQGNKTVAALVSEGITRVVGAHKAFVFSHDEGEMNIQDQGKRLMAIQSRLAKMPNGFMCIRALKGRDAVTGWDIISEMLRWRNPPDKKQAPPDWNKARRMVDANDMMAYSAYMATFKASETEQRVSPQLWIAKSAVRLVQAMNGASSGENGKPADSATGPVLQSLRIGALAFQEGTAREPEEDFIAKRMDAMPANANGISLHIAHERARQDYRKAGVEGVSLARVKIPPSLRVM